jgi:hypothetical protein
MKFYFTYYLVERYLCAVQKPSHFSGCSLHPVLTHCCFMHKPGLPMCVISGALFRYWSLFPGEWSRPCVKVIYLFFTFRSYLTYSKRLASFSSKGLTSFRPQIQDIQITLHTHIHCPPLDHLLCPEHCYDKCQLTK